jgi:hypothetical protein
MLDYFGKKDDIESGYKRLFRLAEVPLNRFDTLAFQIGKEASPKISYTGTIIPQLLT